MWNFPAKKNIGIHVCRKYNHQFHANRRTWYQLEIGKELLKRGYRVFIIGHEDAIMPETRDDNPGFVYALGQPLEDISGLIGRLDCMVNEDSGIMHVTAAMNTPQVAIFGPTSDVKNAPWSEKSLVVRKDIQCSPCQYTERAGNCYKNICMDIDVSYIVQHVEDLL
jgi:ADP-heptose:LPS heptosyltransferase